MSLDREVLRTPLENFEAIALEQMDSVALLNRVDSKYVMPAESLPHLLRRLAPDYYVLEIAGHRAFSYNTVYFDTPEFQFYQDHHNGLGNRIKVRCRQYEETSVTFFEIKRKYAGSRTDKYRRSVPLVMQELDELAYDAIHTKYNKHPFSTLSPALHNRFCRITLVSKNMTERCTIDYNVSFRTPAGHDAQAGNLVIVELKQSRMNSQSAVVKALKEMRIRQNSISKYAYGLMLTNPQLKQNAFKPLVHRLARLNKNIPITPNPTKTLNGSS